MKTLQRRYSQANKETRWSILLTLGYFAWWYISAYKLSSPTLEHSAVPELYFGLPLWFLLSCIVGPALFTLLCILMVKFIYKDISLEIEQEQNNND